MTDDVSTLDESSCWELVEGHEYGRLAVAIGGEPDIFPINYHARDRKLYLRTAAGSKLAGLTINGRVAFEYDEITPDCALSVILHGTARELDDPDEREFFESLPLQPWVDTIKTRYVEIDVEQITGRKFALSR